MLLTRTQLPGVHLLYSWSHWLILLLKDNPGHLSIVMCTIFQKPSTPVSQTIYSKCHLLLGVLGVVGLRSQIRALFAAEFVVTP